MRIAEIQSSNKQYAEASTPSAYSREQFMLWAKQYAQQHNVPLGLVLHAMNKETGHIKNPARAAQVISPKGAVGVMQLLPSTAKELGLDKKDLTDPKKNIEAGVRYLAQQYNRFQDPKLALAAYNAGPGAVQKYGGVPPYKETRNYVRGYDPEIEKQFDQPAPATIKNAKTTTTPVSSTAPTGTKVDLGANLAMLFGKAQKDATGTWRYATGAPLSPQNAAEAERRYSAGNQSFVDRAAEKISSAIPAKAKEVLPPALGGQGKLASQVFSPKSDVQTNVSTSAAPAPVSQNTSAVTKTTNVPTNSKLTDFERAFATARSQQGPTGTFTWTNPRTGKTGTYTTAYRNEKTSTPAPASESINTELNDILILSGRLK